MDQIPLYKALVEQDELDAVAGVLATGRLGMGALVSEFECAAAHAIGAEHRYAAAVSTGHAALHLAVILAGIGPGDEVITPSLAHLADVQAIAAAGATPVFCDVDEATLCLDVERAAELVGPHTKAVLALDYGCHLCDHDAVGDLADSAGLRVIHDAAHAFGSSYGGRPIGSFSDLCMFSFDPVKTLSCIDGGLLLVRSEDELRRVQRLRRIGSSEPAEMMYRNERAWTFDVAEVGYRYHLSNVHAAFGMAQLRKLDRIRAARQWACRQYNEQLAEADWLDLPDTDFADVNPFLYYVRVPGGRRDEFRAKLEGFGIETGVHWHPAHRLTQFSTCRQGPLTVTDRAADDLVSLPLHSDGDPETIDRVCEAILAFPL
jgi:dTDP-4-amino-4,6-dideoxygalactose transaminase